MQIFCHNGSAISQHGSWNPQRREQWFQAVTQSVDQTVSYSSQEHYRSNSQPRWTETKLHRQLP